MENFVLIFKLKKENESKSGDAPRKTSSHKEEAKRQEYLLLNYPADVRRNLRGLSNLNFDQGEVPKKKQEKPPTPGGRKKGPSQSWRKL